MTLAVATPARVAIGARPWRAIVGYLLCGLLCLLAFGASTASHAQATFGLSPNGASLHIPDLRLPARNVSYVLGTICLLLAAVRATVDLGVVARRTATAVVAFATVVSLFLWADAGSTIGLVGSGGLLNSTIDRSLPLILGALAGVMCERSGVINVAIEGQFLVGAFMGALFGSIAGVYAGLAGAMVAGGLVGLLLAVFAIQFLVDQVVLGVVLNLLAAGLTNFFYDRILIPYSDTLNTGNAMFAKHAIPGLSDIPILGPALFDASDLQYITYVLVIVVHVGLFHTRWGLRTRAVGEHPEAADTVGIKVLLTRYRNVILGGMIAGIGGAYFSIGSGTDFSPGTSSGKGFIALAALIFGRWTPIGAVGAALLFGFADAAQTTLSFLKASVPSSILLMAPYLATIVAVAGLVGRVRAPAADGKPYVKG